MATFKVGQRVRIVGITHPEWISVTGREATVIGPLNPAPPSVTGKPAYRVHIDGGQALWCKPEHMQPLTDPLAEQFMERIKKLAREPQPLVQVKA